jgi:hypothetical protein
MILCTPIPTIFFSTIPTIFFSSFPTWRYHNHFVKVKYMTRGPIGKNVVYYVHICTLSLQQQPPYLCFLFIGKQYIYNRFRIKCGSYFFMITTRVFNFRVFSAANEVCSLFSTRIGPFYITSF